MTSALITEQEMYILKNMIGKEFTSYKCDPFVFTPTVYGIVGIYVDGHTYKLTSLLENRTRFFSMDDVAIFKITEADGEDIKTFMDGGKMIETPVNAIISSISVVNDYQVVEKNGRPTSFNSTVGIVFHLDDAREISFEIGTWFSEMITVERGYNLIEKFTPTSEFIEEWEDCEGYIPKCSREIIEIK